MNIRDLRYLSAVAEYKSFRKAAESCFISQPTLSMQLKKMEEFLQVKLIERSSRNIMLTQAGEEILKKARDIIRLSDEILLIADNFRNPNAGNIRLGAFPTLAPYYFPKIMPFLNKNFPELNIYLFEEKTEKLLEMLNNGEIDAAFLAMPIKDKTLEVKKIFSENFYLAAPKALQGNVMKFKRDKVSMNDIRHQKLLLLEEGHCMRDQALQVCKISGATENKEFRATSLETLRNMVAAGMGMTLMPELAMNENDSINYMPFDAAENARRDIALIWRKGSARDKLFRDILVELQELKLS